jgi:DNA-binding NarL/FixJ family response regulator
VEPPGPLRLLIADDHELFAHGLQAMISSDATEVVGIAKSGREAVELALALVPDVLLLDLGLPDGDGFAVLRELAERGARTRAVIVSGSDELLSTSRAIELGAVAFVKKSQPLVDLTAAIETAATLARTVA